MVVPNMRSSFAGRLSKRDVSVALSMVSCEEEIEHLVLLFPTQSTCRIDLANGVIHPPSLDEKARLINIVARSVVCSENQIKEEGFY